MRPNTGSITYYDNEKCYRAFFTTPAGKRTSKRFKVKQDAVDWVAAQTAAVASASFVEPSQLTCGEWLVIWLSEYKKTAVSQRTYEFYAGIIARCEPISSIKLQQIEPITVQQFYTHLLEHITARTVKATHNMLKAAFTKAVNLGLLARNAVSLVEPPKVTVRTEVVTFTADEIQEIYKTAKQYAGGRYYLLFLLAATTGARLGELQTLRWSDINFQTGEISISRSLSPSAQLGDIIKEPKTKAGIRKLTVPAQVVAEIKARRMVSQYIFTTSTGVPISRRNIERAYKLIMEQADVPYRNFHVFRHTHATDLLAAGVPVIEVARRLGHSRITHTLELYGHAIPSYDKQIAAKVAELYPVQNRCETNF